MPKHTIRTPPPSTRDAGLRRLKLANSWLVAGSVTLTGVLAEVAARTFPGRSVSTAYSVGVSGVRARDASSHTSRSTQPLQAPAHPPQAASTQPTSAPATEAAPAQEPAPVVSGGS